MSKTSSLDRKKAREKIVKTARLHRARICAKVGLLPKRITMYEAVCICRRNRLVGDEVLIEAGFNPIQRRRRLDGTVQ